MFFDGMRANFLDEGRVCTRKANLMLKGMNISLTEKAILVHFLTTYKYITLNPNTYTSTDILYKILRTKNTNFCGMSIFSGSGIWRAQFKSRTCV